MRPHSRRLPALLLLLGAMLSAPSDLPAQGDLSGPTIYFLGPLSGVAESAGAGRFSVSADSATVLRFGGALLTAAIQGRWRPELSASTFLLNNPLDPTTCVTPLPGNRVPRYPAAMQQGGMAGEVWGTFIVDASGRVDPASFEALLSDHVLFAQAVREAVLTHRFQPAQGSAAGAVPSRVHQRFTFYFDSGD